MRLVRQTVNGDDLLSRGRGSCQVMDESHICFIHSRATSCYNNSSAAQKMQGKSPREAGRRVREMLTMLKPTVVTDSTPIGLEVEWEDGPKALTENLLPIISWDRQMQPVKVPPVLCFRAFLHVHPPPPPPPFFPPHLKKSLTQTS